MKSRALFTACNAPYIPGALALLRSAERHHPDIPRYCMVIEQDAAAVREAVGQLATVLTPPRAIAGVPERMQTCVLKLFAPTLPAEIVAYVDADAIFCAPAPELWEVSGGKVRCVRSGPREVICSVPHHLKELYLRQFPDFAHEKCLNGGLFSIETAAWRDLPERYEQVVAEGGYAANYHPILDQPLLHAIFHDRVDWLPRQFNVADLFDNPIPHDTRILHFTGGTAKPWNPRYSRIEPQFYWWLRHGLGVTDPATLFAARLRVALWTPKRLLSRALRHWRDRRDAAAGK